MATNHGFDDETRPIKHAFSQDLNPDDDSLTWYERTPKRYVVAFMAFLGFCNVYALRVNLSMAIVAMVNNRTVRINGSDIEVVDFDWDSKTQGLLLGAFFYGYIVTQLPGGWLATRYGGKHLFGVGILGTAIFTIITPPAARMSVWFLFSLRVIEGLFEGVTYPSIHALWAKWAPPLERSKLATIAFSGSYVGTVLAMPITGAIAQSIGWPWIFYITGFLGVIWYILWCTIVTESPASFANIQQSELDYITQSIGYTPDKPKDQKIPWLNIFMSPSVWAITVAHFAENWGFYTMLTELPTFLNNVMGYDLYKAGLAAALPYLAMACTVLLGGQLADYIRAKGFMSTTNVRKTFNCTAFLAQAAFMLIAAHLMSPVGAVACLTVAVGFGGFAWSGFSVNHLDIAPQFAGILMGISNTIATIPGIASPTLTGHIIKDGDVDEWRIIFYIAAGIYGVGALLYAIFASGELQYWAQEPMGYEPQQDSESHQDIR